MDRRLLEIKEPDENKFKTFFQKIIKCLICYDEYSI